MRSIAFLLTALLIACCASFAAGEDNSIMAICNGKAITRGDVKAMYEFQVYQLTTRTQPVSSMNKADREKFEATCDQILTSLVRNKAFNMVVADYGTAAELLPLADGTKKQLDEVVDNAVRTEPDLAAWSKFLSAIGMDTSAVRTYVYDMELTRYIARRAISGPDLITPKEMLDYYNANKDKWTHPELVLLRVITLPYSEFNGYSGAEKVAKEVLEKLKAGTAFETLVAEYSRDTYVEKGGLMDEMAVGDLNASMSSLISKLKDGEYTDPFQLSSSFKIMKLEKRTPAGTRPFAEVRADIKRLLEMESLKLKQDKWVTEIYDKATVRYVHPTVKAVIEAWERQREAEESAK